MGYHIIGAIMVMSGWRLLHRAFGKREEPPAEAPPWPPRSARNKDSER